MYTSIQQKCSHQAEKVLNNSINKIGIMNLRQINYTVKPVKDGHSKKDQKLVFKTNYRLMQVESIAECFSWSILQYIRPSLRYHLSLRPLFCIFLSGRFRQVLLYISIQQKCSHQPQESVLNNSINRIGIMNLRQIKHSLPAMPTRSRNTIKSTSGLESQRARSSSGIG